MPRIQLAFPRGTVQLSREQAVATVRGLLTTGPGAVEAVRDFERRFAVFAGGKHARATSSGKAALVCILRALGAKRGDGVVLACYNVPEVISVLGGLGLRAQLVDIDGATYNLDPSRVESAIDRGTRFVLATHLYGNPADLGALADICRRRGLELIEDCAQAIGARYRSSPVGTFGRAALFSFGLMKTLNTLKGGMVLTDDAALAGDVSRQLQHAPGESATALAARLVLAGAIRAGTRPLPFTMAGYPVLRAAQAIDPRWIYRLMKMRPDELESGHLAPEEVVGRMEAAQARCGAAGIDELEPACARRSANATRLAAALATVAGVRPQTPTVGATSAWTQFVVRTPRRDALKARLLRDGIDTTEGYLQACHRLPGTGLEDGSFPQSEGLERDNLYLPVSDELRDGDVDRIAESVRRAVEAPS
jgi:dTDP-4-amino-4,6-dideoxygalactose transaminase